MSRVSLLSESTGLDGATGQGAKLVSERSVPSRCMRWTPVLCFVLNLGHFIVRLPYRDGL